ncbi:MAG: glycosyltransferase family 39 protein [Syntrophales bacterium]
MAQFSLLCLRPDPLHLRDKPPVALWLQVAGVKLFGFHPLSILLPQVLEGAASVWLLFHLVRRRFSSSAALLAALFFAVTPMFVSVNRTNNTNSCIVPALLMAAWPLIKAEAPFCANTALQGSIK